MTERYDVIAIGEVLVEFALDGQLQVGADARLGVSGDAFNVAAAAAAAGARTALACVLGDDGLGDLVAAELEARGIDTGLVRRRVGQQGLYVVHADAADGRVFSYARRGSIGSSIEPGDLDDDALRSAGAVVASGILGAISPSGRAALVHAAEVATTFLYDPNLRPALTSAIDARTLLEEIAPHASAIAPSYPGETSELLGVSNAHAAAAVLRSVGVPVVLVTRGDQGVLLSDGATVDIPVVTAPRVVDSTGAGDAFLGSFAARLALGDTTREAAGYASAAAALSLGGQGGAGVRLHPEAVHDLLATGSRA